MAETGDRIQIELPIEKEFARLLRLMVSGVASRMNFDLDAVDDLRIAIEEAYLMAMRYKVADPLKVSFTTQPDRLQIDFKGMSLSSAEEENQKEDFGSFILGAVVDEMEVSQENKEFNLSLTKYS